MTQKHSKSSKITPFLSIFASFLTILAIFTLIGCSKSGASEKDQMMAYAKSNNITYTEDPSGILYQIITPGTGAKPSLSNTITVTYVGQLMNGNQFDAGTITYPLSSLITGWQKGLPLIGVGGEIKLLIPSTLGYGSAGAGSSIPGNAPLYFDVKLSAVK
ncbi:MAG: FKBP-type peptidyl-prolyl cis-trans isomerase [Chitinophagia bacterium]